MLLEERHEIIQFSPKVPLKIFMHKLGYVAKHWHKSLELLLVLEGNITITIDGESFFLKNEDVILINSNQIHEISSENAVMIALQIDLALINQFENSLEYFIFDCNSSTCNDARKFDQIKYIIATMLKENAKHSTGIEYKNYALSYYLVAELIAYFQVPATKQIKKQQKYMIRLTRIINYIKENYAKNFSLSELATAENLSVPYLSNFFYKYMGVNFSDYYTNIKLTNAVSDLISTDDSIESIAFRNGFTQAHSFVRCFKKEYKVPPSTYRKNKKALMSNNISMDNLNYLLIEPSSYLHLLTKYLPEQNLFSPIRSSEDIKQIHIPNINLNSPIKKLKHNFKKFTSVGRAKELLNSNIQKMLTDLQSNIGFEYIKFHGIFSDDMMVVHNNNGKLIFNYTLIDMALDFLDSIKLKPLIQLSFMPQELASDLSKTIFFSPFNTSPPKDMHQWEMLVEDFTKHIIDRYGLCKVESWLFCVWNEPMTPKSMFGFNDDKMFYSLYETSYKAIKRVHSKLVFGSPSILYMKSSENEKWIKDYINYCNKNNCMPEFLNVHYYSDIISPSKTADFNMAHSKISAFPENLDDFSDWIEDISNVFSSLHLQNCPLYLTEWNFTVSHRNLINDTCFKSCYITKNLLENYDKLDSFGYWSLTDLIEENPLPNTIFHGGLGIYTINGIRKNVFYSFYFANKLGDELIACGDGYFITKNEYAYQIITYNYVHYGSLFAMGELFDITQTNRYSAFDMSKTLQFHLNFLELENGTYNIREYSINRNYGSAYDIWLDMGAVELSAEDTDILRNRCVPNFLQEFCLIEKNNFTYSPILQPLEIRFTEIKKTSL